MANVNTENVAARLVSAFTEQHQVPTLGGALDLPQAYDVQAALIARLQDLGWNLAGGKIGISDVRALKVLGLKEPVSEVLFDRMKLATGATLLPSQYNAPRVEADLCLTLSRDLKGPDITEDEIRSSIASVAPAIEIVDSRWRDWGGSIPEAVAENVSSAFFVFGDAVRFTDTDVLDNCTMELSIDCVVTAQGDAGACYGSPLRSLHWPGANFGAARLASESR